MARKALLVKSDRKKATAARRHAAGKPISRSTQVYNRCKKCGKNGGYMRKFEICRICFRELARDGKIMGITKSSW
jgi:small subunit ribosomal protein S14